METTIEKRTSKAEGCVQSNLWGMETSQPARRAGPESKFNRIYEEWKLARAKTLEELKQLVQSNLWGMETSLGAEACPANTRVQSNLWGMETTVLLGQMPNRIRFNRIYEEWKRFKTYCEMIRRHSSIESMRNGNCNNLIANLLITRVQSNLWGMETAARRFMHPGAEAVQSNLWGMETECYQHDFCGDYRVQSNLWGMETWCRHPSQARLSLVQSNLWGMETSPRWLEDLWLFFVQSNLWGMETVNCALMGSILRTVQSNLWGMETHAAWWQCQLRHWFNRIYEEWKLLRVSSSLSRETGSIESMRNGNTNSLKRAKFKNFVQSNLWGMETKITELPRFEGELFNRIYEEWKPRARGLWGPRAKAFNRIYEEWKHRFIDGLQVTGERSIESMRNGNLLGTRLRPQRLPFNRIYEEWKRGIGEGGRR